MVLGFPLGHQVLGLPKIHTKGNTVILGHPAGLPQPLHPGEHRGDSSSHHHVGRLARGRSGCRDATHGVGGQEAGDPPRGGIVMLSPGCWDPRWRSRAGWPHPCPSARGQGQPVGNQGTQQQMPALTLDPSLLFSPAGPIWPSSPCQERGEESARAKAASDPLPAPPATQPPSPCLV